VAVPHFFVGSLDAPVVLSERDSRHAIRSLRLRRGDPVTLADGRGQVAMARLAGEQHGVAVIDVQSVRQVARPGTFVSVALAPPKGDRLSWAIQKLAELGVDEAILVHAERSVRAWQPDRADRAVERLDMVVREAAMQSHQAFLMEVRAGPRIEDLFSSRGMATVLLWEGKAPPLSEALPEAARAVRLVIGPEGGFTEAEVGCAAEAGAVVASLGQSILRTETAAIVGATLALSRYGRLG
jgi:16S rRNA (uracil1498-N3)-methyltransferase